MMTQEPKMTRRHRVLDWLTLAGCSGSLRRQTSRQKGVARVVAVSIANLPPSLSEGSGPGLVSESPLTFRSPASVTRYV